MKVKTKYGIGDKCRDLFTLRSGGVITSVLCESFADFLSDGNTVRTVICYDVKFTADGVSSIDENYVYSDKPTPVEVETKYEIGDSVTMSLNGKELDVTIKRIYVSVDSLSTRIVYHVITNDENKRLFTIYEHEIISEK